jgi:hypothetical protein
MNWKFTTQKARQKLARAYPSGFEDKVARAQRFAAEMALQSYALRAAGEGGVLAYGEVTGETWKPYEAPQPASDGVSRRALVAGMTAFQNRIIDPACFRFIS